MRLLIFRCKIEKHFEFSLQEKLSNSSGKMYGVSIFWMSVSTLKFISGSQELSYLYFMSIIRNLYFNDSKVEISESLVSLKLTPALNSSLNENNLMLMVSLQ